MVDKTPYVERFKELYAEKEGEEVSDELALEYFEQLALLVETITSDMAPGKIIIVRP